MAGSALAQRAASSDWPQWRGPNRDDRSADTGLLQQWPKGGPPLAWKGTGLGKGMGGIAVSSGRIYTTGDDAENTAWILWSGADRDAVLDRLRLLDFRIALR